MFEMLQKSYHFFKKQFESFTLTDKIMVALLLALNTLFCVLKSSPITISFYEMDSYSFLQKLITMYEGIIEFNPVKHFSYGYYNYGYAYFLELLVLSFPFLATKQYAVVVFIGRFISVCAMVGSVILMQRILHSILKPIIVTLVLATLILNTLFFMPSILFYPDWIMAFFVILALYYQLKEAKVNSKLFWISLASFGLAVGIKFQALIYAPFLIGLVSWKCWNEATSLKTFLKSLTIVAIKVFFLWSALFILINPFVLHPKGLVAFSHRFEENITRSDKSIYVLLSIVILPIFYYAFYTLKKQKVSVTKHSMLGLSVLLYCFYQVNHYFVTKYNIVLLFLSILIIAILLKEYKVIFQKIILTVLCLFTFSLNINYIKESINQKVFFKNNTKLDQITDITKIVATDISPSDHILMTAGTPINYLELGLPLTHIHFVMGSFLPYHIEEAAFYGKWKKFDLKNNPNIKPFREKKYIIINKQDQIFTNKDNSSYKKTTETLTQLRQSKWNYGTIYETSEIIIFKNKGPLK
ncbi:MAG: hypothetical protein CMP39_01325 [Rickettsiales bacterium]|nr:hypothetical protein [Rickettsiales bacterium]